MKHTKTAVYKGEGPEGFVGHIHTTPITEYIERGVNLVVEDFLSLLPQKVEVSTPRTVCHPSVVYKGPYKFI